MDDGARRRATYKDVLDAPPHMVAEIVDGDLHTQPRPASPHAAAAAVLTMRLGPPFRFGEGGPGGWVLLVEPELHLADDILVPDLAGWRRERMPEMPDAAFFTLAPDFACEVASPSTTRLDRVRKLPVYARERVPHLWIVDPAARTLEVLRLDGATYRIVGSFGGDGVVRAEPFDAVELALAGLWER